MRQSSEAVSQWVGKTAGRLYMPPRSANENRVNLVLRNPELFSDPRALPARRNEHIYFDNVFFRQFCRGILRPFVSEPLATLSKHIVHVVLVSSRREVPWIAAWRVVAGVQNIHAIWNLAICNLPREPVSIFDALRPLAMSVAFGAATHPWPASVKATTSINARKKILGEGKIQPFRCSWYTRLSQGKPPSCMVRDADSFAASGISLFTPLEDRRQTCRPS